jgi:lipopolysaccharide biosynthesis regulator YciM
VLLAAAAGVAAGRAWAGARRSDQIAHGAFRLSSSYVQGLESLSRGEREAAAREFEKVAREEPQAFDVQLVLGHLCREAGQIERAMKVHQGLLSWELSRSQRAVALVALGLDQRAAGFLDRATRSFEQALEADSRCIQAIEGMARVHEDQKRWRAAFDARSLLQRLRKSDDSAVLAHIQVELGREARAAGRGDEAERAFRTALKLDRRVFPAYLGLADLALAAGSPQQAVAVLDEAIRTAPERAYLAFERLSQAFSASGMPSRFVELCEDLVRRDPQDWRARLALAQKLRAEGRPQEAYGLLLRALTANPHVLLVHLEMLRVLKDLGVADPRVVEYGATSADAVFYRDPHVCTRCRYRADDMLWRCPHCHEWDSFVEERWAPASAGSA